MKNGQPETRRQAHGADVSVAKHGRSLLSGRQSGDAIS